MIFFFKKKFGQNFLKDSLTLKKIVSLAKIKRKFVIEIGPGAGALTKLILKEEPKKLIVIEKDKSLEDKLIKIKNVHPNNFEFFIDDALFFDFKRFNKTNMLIFGNLPFNIASSLIINLIKLDNTFEYMVMMVQKEVADRFIASVSTKSYGRLSVLVQLQSEVNKIFDVSPEKFFPKPKVFSTVIGIKPKTNLKFEYNKLDTLLKNSFRHRRKTLKNNLKDFTINSEKKIINCGIDPNLRPQDIKPEEYLKLSKHLIQ